MFTKKHWGNYAWGFLDAVVLTYPAKPSSQEKQNYRTFFTSLQSILPCPMCRDHYAQNLKKYSLDQGLESREHLIRWLTDVHNSVNVANGKRKLSYKEARACMEGKFQFTAYHGAGIILILVLMFFLSRKLKI